MKNLSKIVKWNSISCKTSNSLAHLQKKKKVRLVYSVSYQTYFCEQWAKGPGKISKCWPLHSVRQKGVWPKKQVNKPIQFESRSGPLVFCSSKKSTKNISASKIRLPFFSIPIYNICKLQLAIITKNEQMNLLNTLGTFLYFLKKL